MNAYEVAKAALSDGAQLFRERKEEPGQYDCKPFFTGSKRGWVALDTFSASAIVAVYDALNLENRERFLKLGVLKMAKVAFKLAK